MNLSEQTNTIQSFIQTHHDLSKLNEKEVSDFYILLIDCLVDHNHQYYIEANPIISDKEYDELFEYLKKIEEHFPQIITSNSPTQGLVGQVSDPDGSRAGGFEKAEHTTKLMSLENTYNAQDLKDWEERAKKIVEKSSDILGNSIKFSENILYIIEPKFDGLSVELIYKNGIFTQAITRGDGRVGEDITVNVQTIKNIPKKLLFPIDISVRGEIVMPKSVRKELNKEREEYGETPFANTRNAAAGSIKLLDPKEVSKRGLLCYVYDILTSAGAESKDIVNLTTLGFDVFPRKKTATCSEEIISICENPETKKSLDVQDSEFDGLVIKVQDEQQREIIGSTDHHPRRAVAYKFPAQLTSTQITSVDFQVGRTGIITPVANLNPVQLSGATLKRVSLHNFDFIKEKDIHVHDWIRLQRSGEVIPYIVSVITDRRITHDPLDKANEMKSSEAGRANKGGFISPPTDCPSCNEIVTNRDGHYYCTNPHCPEKTKQQIQHFVSKNCMDIQGIGESVVDLLVENKIIKNITDIYKLSDIHIQLQLLKFPGFGDKKVAEIAKGIEESKHKALRRVLNGLGIPHVGKKMAQDLSETMINDSSSNEGKGEMINLLTKEEFLTGIYGIGEKSVETITAFFSDPKNLQLIEQLNQYGVNMDPQKYNDLLKTSEAKGSFSITGTFPISREKITELFQENGYIFHESPTKTTDFMLIGEKAGSKKNKAQEIGLTIYEGREHIIEQFPFLKTITNDSNKPKIQSLF